MSLYLFLSINANLSVIILKNVKF